MTRSKHLAALIVAIVSLSLAGGYILMLRSAPTEIRMATWRNDDFVIWNSTLLPPFQAQHSDITISYNSEASNYSGRLRKAFELGRAADVVACYPGKIYHEFAQNGYLRPLGELEVLQGYAPDVLETWQSVDDGEHYCLPVAAVGHGFIYNKRIFGELGLAVPQTRDAFHQVLETIQADGRYTPMTMGLADDWIATAMGLELIGPNYWNGDLGLKEAARGVPFSSPQGEALLRELSTWPAYMEPDPFLSTRLNALERFSTGQVAILPTGSWDIPLLRLNPIEDYGVFAAPRLRAEDPCFVTWHNDLGFAINAATDHPQEAAAFISYLSSDEFLQPMEEHLPGFFAMRPTGSPTTNPLVNAFIAAKDSCETTQRLSLNQYFNMSGRYYDTLSSTLIDVMRHSQSPQEAAAQLDALWGK